MQLLCAENDTAMSMEKPTSNPSCAMYSHVPNESQSASVGPIDASTKSNGQPYYLCTVTCCDSANCTKPSTTNLISKAIVTKTDACLYSRFSTQTSTGRSICPVSPLNPSNCPACIKTRQARPRLVLLTNPTSDYSEDEYLSPSIKAVQESIGSSNHNANKSELSSSPLLSKGFQQQAKDSATRRSPKPQLSSERGREVHSPELSSSPPILGNSSFTDYTEPYTPVCTSVNSNPPDSVNHFKFGVSRKASPLNSEYSFYFSNVENHGFFRKAVPALPISMAVLFCLCNLVIPGSGLSSFLLIPYSLYSLCVIKQSESNCESHLTISNQCDYTHSLW